MNLKPTIAAVAFDMDGLMFNTEDLYDKVGEILLQRRGQHFTLELKLEMMGLPGKTAFEIMRQRCNLAESVESLQNETDGIFKEILPREIETMPGLLDLLDLLESNNIPKCVCTSSHQQFATTALGHFDLQSRFERILTAEDVVNGKPHPEVYLTAANKFGVTPDQMLVLEDSHIGSRAGAASGAFTIAVPTKHSLEMDFSHVQHVAESLQDNVITRIFREG